MRGSTAFSLKWWAFIYHTTKYLRKPCKIYPQGFQDCNPGQENGLCAWPDPDAAFDGSSVCNHRGQGGQRLRTTELLKQNLLHETILSEDLLHTHPKGLYLDNNDMGSHEKFPVSLIKLLYL